MDIARWRSALCFGVVLFGIEAAAVEEKKPATHIEAFGDSITAGFLSDKTILTPPGLSTVSQIMSELLTIELNGDKHEFKKFEARDSAWPAVLRGWMAAASRPTTLTNVAVSGGFVHELPEQIERAGARTEPTAAFFWIGHNDLCNNHQEPDKIGEYFADHYKNALEQWDKNHSDSTAYILPLGDIHRMYKALDGYVWYDQNGSKFRCDDSWLRLFPYCRQNSRLFKQGKFDEYYLPRQAAIGRALTQLATKMTTASRSNRFVYLDNVLSEPYKTGFFSIDCYHLSKVGQSGVATEIFRRVGQEMMGIDGKVPVTP